MDKNLNFTPEQYGLWYERYGRDIEPRIDFPMPDGRKLGEWTKAELKALGAFMMSLGHLQAEIGEL